MGRREPPSVRKIVFGFTPAAAAVPLRLSKEPDISGLVPLGPPVQAAVPATEEHTASDSSLLQAFVLRGNQDAFGTVVRRHLDLVFGTALRQLDDRMAAEEVCQNVFIVLARKSAWLSNRQQLSGWLYETTLLECRQRWRADLRRKRREQTAIELGTTMDTPNPGRDAMTQMLDEGLQQLRADDRDVLLLRYFERRSLRDVGRAIGTTEDTAQKRVARALDQLTRFFQRRGHCIAGGEIGRAHV